MDRARGCCTCRGRGLTAHACSHQRKLQSPAWMASHLCTRYCDENPTPMDPKTELFQHHRGQLFKLAYRMLGATTDAEDVLQDAWLRWHAENIAALEDPAAWLATVTTRIAVDKLRRAKLTREQCMHGWISEPPAESAATPDAELGRDETIIASFTLLLERLSSDERAAFLLHEVFDYSHAETAAILGLTDNACRQRAHRARGRLQAGQPRFRVDATKRRRLLKRFIAAIQMPNLDTLRALLGGDGVHTGAAATSDA